MEEKNEKSKKGLIVTLVVIIVLLLGACGYFVYTDYFAGKSDNKKNSNSLDSKTSTNFNDTYREYFNLDESDITNKGIDKALSDSSIDNYINDSKLISNLKSNNLLNGKLNDVNISDCSYLLDQLHSLFGYGYFSFEDRDIYHVNDFLANSISNEIKMEMVGNYIQYKKYSTYNTANGDYLLTTENFNKYYFDLFGNTDYTKISSTGGGRCPGVVIKDDYVLVATQCGGLLNNPTFYDLPYKASVQGDELYIYELVGYAEYIMTSQEPGLYIPEEYDEIELYKDKNETEPICNSNCKPYLVFDNHNNNLSSKAINDASKFAEYKYTFKLFDNNYYFTKVERVN